MSDSKLKSFYVKNLAAHYPIDVLQFAGSRFVIPVIDAVKNDFRVPHIADWLDWPGPVDYFGRVPLERSCVI